MNSISIIEFLLVSAIVVIQTTLALRTHKQIKVLGLIIPTLNFFKLKKYNIPIEDLQEFQPKEILQNLASYEKKQKPQHEPVYSENGEEHSDLFSEVEEEEYESQNEVSLINPNESTNEIFDEILLAVNVYLLRNKGAATDFNLIKDVVERNLDMEEEDISHTVTVPLYLGLMGTMVGIVFGLLNLFLVSDANADFDIKGFLGGVSIAMFASFWGLFCTVANSSFNLKTARRSLERAKNIFYTFLQTELLPVLNQSVSSSIYTLHTNLVKFNDNFTINLNKLSGMLNKNHDALIAQERILTALDSIDIAEFAKANVKVLKELKMGTEQLEKFSDYLNSLNHLSAKTSRLSTSFEDLLNRTNNFQGLAEKLDNRIEESNRLVQFLSDHYQHFEFREDVIKELIQKVDDTMIKSLNLLEEHTETKIAAIKQITIKEEDLMTQAFAEKSSHLSKLSLLDDLKKSLNEIKISSAGQIGSIKEEIKAVKGSVENLNTVLAEISNNSFIHRTQNVAKSIKQLFTPKK
jgi:biopolymer transport protein ExbB/TolQ